jgi:hypothetical protein
MQYLLVQIKVLPVKSKPEIPVHISIWYMEDAVMPHWYLVRIADGK